MCNVLGAVVDLLVVTVRRDVVRLNTVDGLAPDACHAIYRIVVIGGLDVIKPTALLGVDAIAKRATIHPRNQHVVGAVRHASEALGVAVIEVGYGIIPRAIAVVQGIVDIYALARGLGELGTGGRSGGLIRAAIPISRAVYLCTTLDFPLC